MRSTGEKKLLFLTLGSKTLLLRTIIQSNAGRNFFPNTRKADLIFMRNSQKKNGTNAECEIDSKTCATRRGKRKHSEMRKNTNDYLSSSILRKSNLA